MSRQPSRNNPVSRQSHLDDVAPCVGPANSPESPRPISGGDPVGPRIAQKLDELLVVGSQHVLFGEHSNQGRLPQKTNDAISSFPTLRPRPSSGPCAQPAPD